MIQSVFIGPGSELVLDPEVSSQNVIQSVSDSTPALSLRANSVNGAALAVYTKQTDSFPTLRFGGYQLQFGAGTGAADITFGRTAAGLLTATAGLALNSMPGTIAPLSVTGAQPTSAAGNGSASGSSSITSGKGGNTTGTTGQVAGAGGSVTLTAGAGGDAPGGSTNGAGGNITLTPGLAGTGAGAGGALGKVIITRGRLQIGSTVLADGGDFSFDATNVYALPKSKVYNVMQEPTLTVGAGVTQAQAVANRDALRAAFQKAANAGVPCLLPAQIIEHIEALWIPSNCHIIGYGKGRSILRTHASVGLNATDEIIRNLNYTNGNDNITLENFEIDGNRANRGAAHDWQNDGTWAGGQLAFHHSAAVSKNLKLINMTIHDAVGVCVNISGVDGFLVQGCEVYNNGRDGVSVLCPAGLGAKNIRYVGNYIYGCGDDCIGLFANNVPIEHVTIVGNVLGYHRPFTNAAWQYGGHAVAMGGVRDAVVEGNVMPRCAIAGVIVFNGYQGGINTERVTVAHNDIYQPGYPKSPLAGGTGAEDSGYGVEIICNGSAGSIVDAKIINNLVHQPMSHGVKMEFRTGSTGTVSRVKIKGNDFNFGTGSQFWTGGNGINASTAVAGRIFDRVDVMDNTFMDTNGRPINAGGFANQYWRILRNDLVSGGKGGANGAGGAFIDISNHVEPEVGYNRVTDFASPQKMQYALNYNATSGLKLSNNNFNTAAPANFTGTVGAGFKQWMNIGRDNVLYAGNATAASMT